MEWFTTMVQPRKDSKRRKHSRAQAKPAQPSRLCEALFNFMYRDVPLILGESEESYVELIQSIYLSIRPRDFLEGMWVKDIADITWEARRAWRLRSRFINAIVNEHHRTAMNTTLRPMMGLGADNKFPDPKAEAAFREKFSEATAKLEGPVALETVFKLVKEGGQGIDFGAAGAKAYVSSIDQLQRVDQHLATLERRANAILREVEEHRRAVSESPNDSRFDPITGFFKVTP